VASWLERTLAAFAKHPSLREASEADPLARRALMDELGTAATEYRAELYGRGLSGSRAVAGESLSRLAELARGWLERCIAQNRREDGLYHAYNLLAFRRDGGVAIHHLFEMLEGQVAVLSTRSLPHDEAVRVLDALAASRMYREDQRSYTLYPDRELPGFLDKNTIDERHLGTSTALGALVEAGDGRIVLRDALGKLRFNAEFSNAQRCREALEALAQTASNELLRLDAQAIEQILEIYEETFQHHRFTGRSGTMFAYEGLGSIYWHMVAKLLLAISERVFSAHELGAPPSVLAALKAHYFSVRQGLGGLNKTPGEYGAFPLDPYSHTPAGSGARQPGMTGQVKEEVLTRLAELGVIVRAGRLSFRPLLLRQSEFLREPARLDTLDLDGSPSSIALDAGTLGFTYCQVPIVLHAGESPRIVVTRRNGALLELEGAELPADVSADIFARTGAVARLDVWLDMRDGLPQ
jgi:hypothetical protein